MNLFIMRRAITTTHYIRRATTVDRVYNGGVIECFQTQKYNK